MDIVAVVNFAEVVEATRLFGIGQGVFTPFVFDGDIAFFNVNVGGSVFSHCAQLDQVTQSAHAYQKSLTAAGYGKITTEMALASEFYYAETYHQQYLHKMPHGYCGLQGTGVAYPA